MHIWCVYIEETYIEGEDLNNVVVDYFTATDLALCKLILTTSPSSNTQRVYTGLLFGVRVHTFLEGRSVLERYQSNPCGCAGTGLRLPSCPGLVI